jgi:choline dehydrogenase-like flavoprotein
MSAANGVNGHANGTSNALCSVEELTSRKYDFVVVGGGTAGLAVAARLTEDPNISVAVLEAGEDRMNDPSVSTPSLYPTMVGQE